MSILTRRFARLPGIDRIVLLASNAAWDEPILREAREIGLDFEVFSRAEVIEQSLSNRPERWGLPNGKGIETWTGTAFTRVAEKFRWDGLILVPLSHLLVDRAGVEESLRLHQREGFDATFAEDRVPGGGWAILENNLLRGMQASHPDLMAARGGLLWALLKPLYPFRIGAFHAPRDRSPLAADLRLNRERVARVLAEAGGNDFADPGFSYGRWIRGLDWQRVYTDFAPTIAHIEPTNNCRGKCVSCPQPSLKRPKGYLESGIFVRLAEKLVGVDDCRWILSGMGEPLAHPGIKEMAERLRGRLVLLETSLSEELSTDFPWDALTHVRVSVDALEQGMFEKLRPGCSWNRIEQFIQEAALRKERRPDEEPEIGVTLVKHSATDSIALAFLQYWKQVCTPVFRTHFFRWPIVVPTEKVQWFQILGASDFLGAIQYPGKVRYTPLNRRTCLHGTLGFHILCDGRVTICPFDIEGQWAIGRIEANGAGVMDIWGGETARAFRKMHLEGAFNEKWPCGDCQDWYHS
ncbi:MAG: SPASM domain-containing protein [Candidatus Riflebacteria bacterium]|nr:SPASM domain-containing protein [Candidatus Riflebacteria bacterium]